MPVRVCFRITQLGGNAVLKLFGDEMLQSLRFFMNLVPRIVEHVVKEAFEQAMVANHFQCTPSTSCRKAYPAVLLITDEGGLLSCQPLHHPRYGSRTNSEPFCQRVARHPIVLCAAQLKNGFEIVVDGFAGCAIFSHA